MIQKNLEDIQYISGMFKGLLTPTIVQDLKNKKRLSKDKLDPVEHKSRRGLHSSQFRPIKSQFVINTNLPPYYHLSYAIDNLIRLTGQN